ncbi:MAG: ArsR family transcriptional regulator [Candidatus Aenigmarchaeota archaeon]|nr:ArsR family transcriptional regulator [Candidatus Aenigmarchaeota archaeon]
MQFLVEEDRDGQRVYETKILINPKSLSCFSNDLCFKIIKEIAKSPACTMDIARKLKQHEQKIYYHVRKLEKFGIIKIDSLEERVGATAKIYSLSSPTFSIKIMDDYYTKNLKLKPLETKFLRPFVENSKINSLIIVGSPDPHGKYKSPASDGYCVINLGAFLGQFVSEVRMPIYKLDTQVNENDLKKNLIIVGGPKTNIISEKINDKLPIYFHYSKDFLDWTIISTISKKNYNEKEIGVIERLANPFSENKEIFFLSGKGFRGTLSAVIGFIKHLKKVAEGNVYDGSIIAKVVKGVDEDGDGIIDDVEFLE